jgi:hypothetical protein
MDEERVPMKESTDRSDAVASGPPASVPDELVSGDLVRQELARLLASQTFHAAKGQKRFLWFVVEQTLAGCAQELKEYTVGVQVFKRGPQFDPRLDTIVRVEARKLRTRLAKYYESEGKHNPLRIALPSRGYVPIFRQPDLVSALTEVPRDSTQDGASAQEVAQLKGEAAERTFRVRTVTERSDGAGMVTTYSVPGGEFAVWLSELQGRRDDEAETILSIWVV